MSAPEKTAEQMRREAAQELISELRAAELKWVDPPGEARGFGRNSKVVWDALVGERIENERLMQWVDDLQSGMYVNCVYCGHRYVPKENVPASMADILKRHIAQCPKHPMSELLRVLGAASHALHSYANRNSSPELADEVAKACDAAIARAKGGK